MVQEVGLSFVVDAFSGEERLHLFEENASDPDSDEPHVRSQYILFPEAPGRVWLPVVLLPCPSFLKIRSVAIERTGASASRSRFDAISKPLANCSRREAHARRNIVGRESLALECKYLSTGPGALPGWFPRLLPNGFARSTLVSACVLCLFAGFSFVPSSNFLGSSSLGGACSWEVWRMCARIRAKKVITGPA